VSGLEVTPINDLAAAVSAGSALQQKRAARLELIRAYIPPADLVAECGDVAFLLGELDRAAVRERVLLEALDVCGIDDYAEDVTALPRPRLGVVAPALATGAAVLLGVLTLLGALVGRVWLAVGRYRRG